MIYVGTSGFSFRGWIGSFYPNGTRSQDMLEYYARQFPAVEINSTYYRLPPASTFQSMVDRTPSEFRFVIKLSGELTHGRDSGRAAEREKSGAGYTGVRKTGRGKTNGGKTSPTEKAVNLDLFETIGSRPDVSEPPTGERSAPAAARVGDTATTPWDAFLEAIAPMEAAGRLDGILAQFPYRFRDTKENRDWLRRIRHHLGSRPAFVEFRHDSWANTSATDLLRDLDLGFTVVDAPNLRGLFPPIVRVSGDTAYFRFHGRNAERWWDGDNSTRYDYLYNESELEEWAGKIHDTAARTRQTFVFFNNCHGGKAAANAQQMTTLLRELSSS